MSDLCFPAVASPVSSCQYTMVPLQGLALVGHCPLDPHLPPPHAVYPPIGLYTSNGKHHRPTHCLPGLHQEDVEYDMECGTLLAQTMSNGHVPVYHYSNSEPEHHGDREDHCFLPDDSTLQLLNTSEQPISSQDLTGNARFYNGDIIREKDINQDLPCSPCPLLSLEEENSKATTSAATTAESQDALPLQEVNTLQSETPPVEQGTSD